jgi:hypothetical protein
MNSFRTPDILGKDEVISLSPVKQGEGEVLIYQEITPSKGETQLPCDALDPLKRRILIAVHTYGINSQQGLKQIASFCDIPLQVVRDLVNGIKENNWLGEELKKGTIPCFTKAELIARLCVEAENAIAPKDRINSIGKLMEFRGLTAPEGGSKSFQRIAMKFKTS